MLATRYAQAYQRTAVESADPKRLVVMLYDAAVRFLYQAKDAMERRDYERQSEALTRAQAIFCELDCSLNLEAGRIAHDLRVFYAHVHNALVEANLRDDAELLGEVTEQVEGMRDAWWEAEARERQVGEGW